MKVLLFLFVSLLSSPEFETREFGSQCLSQLAQHELIYEEDLYTFYKSSKDVEAKHRMFELLPSFPPHKYPVIQTASTVSFVDSITVLLDRDTEHFLELAKNDGRLATYLALEKMVQMPNVMDCGCISRNTVDNFLQVFAGYEKNYWRYKFSKGD